MFQRPSELDTVTGDVSNCPIPQHDQKARLPGFDPKDPGTGGSNLHRISQTNLPERTSEMMVLRTEYWIPDRRPGRPCHSSGLGKIFVEFLDACPVGSCQ